MKINPFIGLLVVIALIFVFVQFLQWIQKKAFFKNNMFSKKQQLPNVNVDLISAVDENYKVVNIKINDANRVVLLGPQNAIVLDEEKKEDKYPYLEKKAS